MDGLAVSRYACSVAEDVAAGRAPIKTQASWVGWPLENKTSVSYPWFWYNRINSICEDRGLEAKFWSGQVKFAAEKAKGKGKEEEDKKSRQIWGKPPSQSFC